VLLLFDFKNIALYYFKYVSLQLQIILPFSLSCTAIKKTQKKSFSACRLGFKILDKRLRLFWKTFFFFHFTYKEFYDG